MVMRFRNSKDRQHNGRKKKDKRTNNNLQNTRFSNTNPTKNKGWGQVSGRVNSFCSTYGTRNVALVANLVISHEQEKGKFMQWRYLECVYCPTFGTSCRGNARTYMEFILQKTNYFNIRERVNDNVTGWNEMKWNGPFIGGLLYTKRSKELMSFTKTSSLCIIWIQNTTQTQCYSNISCFPLSRWCFYWYMYISSVHYPFFKWELRLLIAPHTFLLYYN